jgi:cytochrome c oxidase cbb3-type subunit 2
MDTNRIIIRILLIFAVGIASCFLLDGYTLRAGAASLEEGKRLYDKYCMVCHGEKGEGNGTAARFLFPKPRDLTSGLFKVRSTPTGEFPTDKDILDIIINGMPGSAMPSLSELTKKEMMAIVEYVKELGEISEAPEIVIQPGMPPAITPQLISRGKKVYERMKCWECHGHEGKGDGEKAKDLKDDWKYPAPPHCWHIQRRRDSLRRISQIHRGNGRKPHAIL